MLRHLTKLRLGLSHLRDHKFKHGFLDSLNPICTCGLDIETTCTAQKTKFSIMDFFSKCDQIRRFDLVAITEEILNGKLHLCAVLPFFTPLP